MDQTVGLTGYWTIRLTEDHAAIQVHSTNAWFPPFRCRSSVP